ncbi:MAG TPA: M20/M25/M40 family metallo-hydrolase, partial [Gemmatimonadaceae bacterium]|nr:M20/M25/M40 family metallo-hydrolase [Gemmatimonadaceae bacterium]
PAPRYDHPHPFTLPSMQLRPTLGAVVGAAFLVAPVGAQSTGGATVPADVPSVKAAVAAIRATNAWTLEQQVSICEIPAPPFKEAKRAEEFKRRLEQLGLRNVRIDREGNVIGERPGTGSGPVVVISAHLDTVFPESTDVSVRREGSLYKGPGIGDDCRGLAVLLATAKAMNDAKVATTGTVLFVGTVGEEGPGNLRGVRHLFAQELKGKVDYFISVDGTGLGITSAAVGSHRYRVTYQGPGGHSYGAFGMPNPIHALGRAIAKFGDLQVPRDPRTTFSVGVISGGTSVNSISMSGVMEVDMRSESAAALEELDAKFQRVVQEALAEENARWPESRARLTVKVDTTGIRPAGAQPDSVRIVRVAKAAGRALGFDARTNASSTDSNIPISLGIPAITIDGGGRGRGSHALEESYDDGQNGWLGPQWATLIVAALAGTAP